MKTLDIKALDCKSHVGSAVAVLNVFSFIVVQSPLFLFTLHLKSMVDSMYNLKSQKEKVLSIYEIELGASKVTGMQYFSKAV